MNVTENICPICNKSNELEAVVCWNCGAALEDPFLDPGASTKTTVSSASVPQGMEDWSIGEAEVPRNGIAVYVEGVTNPAYTDSGREFVIGRRAGNTSQVAEALLDLSPLGGYGLGISRRHAVIRRTKDGYEVLDLGSVNGSWLNGERLVPHKSYPLVSGSHIRLGSMRLFVIYGSFAETK